MGGPLEETQSDAKFDRYVATFARHGFARLVIEDQQERFAGYAGIMPSPSDHVLGQHVEIGWRLVRSFWGNGYATEAARAVLHDAFTRVGVTEVLAYTASDNERSQAVMNRLGLRRVPTRDFSTAYNGKMWRGLVWVAAAADGSLTSR
jgi:RimJ/RimL family protein N-acetyltransferase